MMMIKVLKLYAFGLSMAHSPLTTKTNVLFYINYNIDMWHVIYGTRFIALRNCKMYICLLGSHLLHCKNKTTNDDTMQQLLVP